VICTAVVTEEKTRDFDFPYFYFQVPLQSSEKRLLTSSCLSVRLSVGPH
jgi:hypothetical protein